MARLVGTQARFEFSGNEAQTAVHALRMAAARFEEDASMYRDEHNNLRLAEQFDRQAKDSRELADKIERAGS